MCARVCVRRGERSPGFGTHGGRWVKVPREDMTTGPKVLFKLKVTDEMTKSLYIRAFTG